MSRLQDALDNVLASDLATASIAEGYLVAVLGKNGKVVWMNEETKAFFHKSDVSSTFDLIPGRDSGLLHNLNMEVDGQAARSWMQLQSGSNLIWVRVEGYPMEGLRFVRAMPEKDQAKWQRKVEPIELA